MTKKDFIFFAELLGENAKEYGKSEQFNHIYLNLCRFFYSQNNRFDKNKFTEYLNNICTGEKISKGI